MLFVEMKIFDKKKFDRDMIREHSSVSLLQDVIIFLVKSNIGLNSMKSEDQLAKVLLMSSAICHPCCDNNNVV